MIYINAGNLDGELEELIKGFVYQSSPTTIKASWLAVDGESGIKNYWVAVGTTPSQYEINYLKMNIFSICLCFLIRLKALHGRNRWRFAVT